MNIYLMHPGKAPGRKIFSLDNSTAKPASADAIALRQEAFNEAKRLMPANDLELAAIRDTVLMKRLLPPGTPGPKGPGTPRPKMPGTPGPKMPGTPMGPPRPPGAASGSGLPR